MPSFLQLQIVGKNCVACFLFDFDTPIYGLGSSLEDLSVTMRYFELYSYINIYRWLVQCSLIVGLFLNTLILVPNRWILVYLVMLLLAQRHLSMESQCLVLFVTVWLKPSLGMQMSVVLLVQDTCEAVHLSGWCLSISLTCTHFVFQEYYNAVELISWWTQLLEAVIENRLNSLCSM